MIAEEEKDRVGMDLSDLARRAKDIESKRGADRNPKARAAEPNYPTLGLPQLALTNPPHPPPPFPPFFSFFSRTTMSPIKPPPQLPVKTIQHT